MNILRMTCLMALSATAAFAQYNDAAGTSAPTERIEVEDDAPSKASTDGEETDSSKARKTTRVIERRVEKRDGHDNAAGNSYDLAVDGAFEGQTVVVLQFYTGGGFDFSLPRTALQEKGFSVYRWSNAAPTPEELEKALKKASQLWIISGDRQHLNEAHLEVIRAFFESGRGLYLWGDNAPYYADANFVAEALFGTTMVGPYNAGEQIVGIQEKPGEPGFLRDHLLTTGLEHLYEGHSIPTIDTTETMAPLMYGSTGSLIVTVYDDKERRAILDTGFTRLYLQWDTAGTGRYVKNAASWLANYERFGDDVLGAAYVEQRGKLREMGIDPDAKDPRKTEQRKTWDQK